MSRLAYRCANPSCQKFRQVVEKLWITEGEPVRCEICGHRMPMITNTPVVLRRGRETKE